MKNIVWSQELIDEYYGKDILKVLINEMYRDKPTEPKPISGLDMRKSFRFTMVCKSCGVDMQSASVHRIMCGKCRSSRRHVDNSGKEPKVALI